MHSISTYLFKYKDDGREELYVDEGITLIGDRAFEGCNSLKRVVLPESLMFVDERAFANCTALEEIVFRSNVDALSFLVFRESVYEYLVSTENQKKLSIVSTAFDGCTSLKRVVFPENARVFSYHSLLGDRVGSVDMFKGLPFGEAEFVMLNSHMLYKCNSTERVITVPDGVKEVLEFAFTDMAAERVILPEGVKRLDRCAFCFCKELKEIVLPKSLEKLGDTAVNGCPKFCSFGANDGSDMLVIPPQVKYFGKRFVENDAIKLCGQLLVGPELFEGMKIRKLELAEGTSYMSKEAFQNHSELESVTLPSTLRVIGSSAFAFCKGLKEVKLSNGLEDIGPMAFYDCVSLTEIDIPDTVLAIGDGCFNSSGIRHIRLSERLSTITSKQFCYSQLESIVIPESVTEICALAFSCTPLSSIKMHDGITSIGDSAFSNCDKLVSFTLPKGVTKVPLNMLELCTSLEMLQLHDGLKVIETAAFKCCFSLDELTIPESVELIESSALYRINSAVVRLPKKWNSLDMLRMFSDSITGYIEYPYMLCAPSIPISDIAADGKLSAIAGFMMQLEEGGGYEDKEIADGYLKYISHQRQRLLGYSAMYPIFLRYFINNKKIKLKDIDKLLDLVQDDLEATALLMNYRNENFSAEDEFAELEKELNRDPFSVAALKEIWGTKKLIDGTLAITSYKGDSTHVEVPSKIGRSQVTAVYDNAFSVASGRVSKEVLDSRRRIVSVKLPEGITSIGRAVFYGCSALEEVELPETLTTIGEKAFAYCTSLREMAMLCVESLDKDTFVQCSALKKVSFSDRLQQLGESCFSRCGALEEVVIPDGRLDSISDMCFIDCTSLKRFDFPNTLRSIGYAAFFKSGLEAVELPPQLERLECFAFQNCKQLKTAKISSVKIIGDAAFSGSGLVSVEIAEGVEHISREAFAECVDLKSVVLPQSLRVIDSECFENCVSLANIALPQALRVINVRAFYKCCSLELLTLPNSLKLLNYDAFRDCSKLVVIVSEGSDAELVVRKMQIRHLVK